jgi:hypothetical protein
MRGAIIAWSSKGKQDEHRQARSAGIESGREPRQFFPPALEAPGYRQRARRPEVASGALPQSPLAGTPPPAAGLTLRVRGFGAAYRRTRSDERAQMSAGPFDNFFVHARITHNLKPGLHLRYNEHNRGEVGLVATLVVWV